MMQANSPLESRGTVLLTGGTGFLGAYIMEHLLRAGYKVKALKRTGSAIPFFIDQAVLSAVQWVEGDVLDVVSLMEHMEGVDAVVHSAAVVSFIRAEREKMYQANVEGTANVVNVALELGVPRLVHISSVAALGRSAQGEKVNEEKAWAASNTNTHYAISKYKAEMEVWRGFGEGLEGVILNPSTILGYGDWNNSSCALFKNVYNEFPWFTEGVNGFVYVHDVAKATVALLGSDISGERFIINGENWSFRQLLNTIADGFRKKHPHRRATPLLGEIAWRMEKVKSMISGQRPLLSKESAKVAHSKTYFDNSKLLKFMPEFSYTPLQEAIALSCQQYLTRHA